MSESPDPLIGAIVDGRWRVTERLGQGGMGTVYRGERLKLGKSVALKFLDERYAGSQEALARFGREARAISLLQHAHCVAIGDFGVHGGRPFIVMEYVAGRSLASLMGFKEMTPVRAIHIMRQVLDALRHAHAHGVVHRDLKPDNVMLAEVTGTEDYVKILDFGLARIMKIEEPEISLPEVVAGTPSWMSPEQASGHRVDHRTDLFTAGVMLYTMCTGQKPFSSDNPAQLLRQIREVQPTRPRKLAPGLSDALERVIVKAMAKSPDARFEDAAAFRAALDATPEAKASARPPASAAGRLLRFALLLVVLGVGMDGAYLYRDGLARQMERRSSSAVAARAEIRPPSPPPAEPAPAAIVPTPAPTAAPAPADAASVPTVVVPAPTAGEPTPTVTMLVAQPAPAEPVASAPTPAPTPPLVRSPTTTPEPAAAAPAPSEAASNPTPAVDKGSADSARAVIDELISAGNYAAAEKGLRQLLLKEPRTAWAHLALGEVYYRRLWRPNALESWGEALRLAPDLRHDTRLGDRLCVALGPKWQGGGARLLLSRFAEELAPTLERCLAAADDYAQLQAVARLLERALGQAHVDRGRIAQRTLELAPGCDDRRAAVRTLVRLRDARAVAALEQLRTDACVGELIPAALAALRPEK